MKTGKRYNLVIDDDPFIPKVIEKITKIPSLSFTSLDQVLSSLAEIEPVAAFVDIHLNSTQSGLEVIPTLRNQWPQAPVLVLTSDTTEKAIEDALSAGADDFIRKPISASELKARLSARAEDRAELLNRKSLRIADITLVPAHHRLTANGKTTYLSPTALNLLSTLVEMKDSTISRDVLKRKVWGRITVTDNALDRKVYEVRKALESISSNLVIDNIYGEGYRLGGNGDASTTPYSPITREAPTNRADSSLRVLLIEDSESDAVLVREALRKGDGLGPFELRRVGVLKDGLELLSKGGVDIVLLDLSLPDAQGIETFSRLNEKFPQVPVVILSGLADSKLSLETVKKGAQDFLSKDEIRPLTLSKTIRYAVSRFDVIVLENAALRERHSELERLSELKSQFLAHMSHEIRTPLNAVIGMTSLLLQSELPPEQMESVRTIRNSGENLLQLLNEILDFSKIQSGKVSFEETSFEIRQIVEEVLDLFSGQACENKLSLHEYVDKAVPMKILADPTRIRQVLVNLVGNAIKFTKSGTVSIACRENEGSLRFEVSDSGPGIKEEDRHRLFEPFSQVNSSTTKLVGGTGLGLVISKKIVEAMGGEIGFESEVGKGSTFFFQMPLKSAQSELSTERVDMNQTNILSYIPAKSHSEFLVTQLKERGLSVDFVSSPEVLFSYMNAGRRRFDIVVVAPEAETEVEGLKGFFSTRTEKTPVLWLFSKEMAVKGLSESSILRYPYTQSRLYRTIANLASGKGKEERTHANSEPSTLETFPSTLPPVLVAEDNQVNQRVMQRMLARLSIKCDIASNGLEATEAVQKNAYSLVLMDCSMPEKDGWTATRELRGKGFTLPIVGMTAHAFKDDRDRCFEVGMDEYLAKPVTIESLAKVLHALLLTDAAEGLEVLNKHKLQVGLGGTDDEEFVREMMVLFVEKAPATFDDLIKALEKKECAEIASLAHRLRGMAISLGAEKLASTCEKIEEKGRAKNTTDALALGGILSDRWKELQSYLENELRNSH